MSKKPQSSSWFTANVRFLIKKKRVTLKELAETAGVRYDWLRRAVANGLAKQTDSNYEQVERIAEALRIDADKLFLPTKEPSLDYRHEAAHVLKMCRDMLRHKDQVFDRIIDRLFDEYEIKPGDRTKTLRETLAAELNLIEVAGQGPDIQRHLRPLQTVHPPKQFLDWRKLDTVGFSFHESHARGRDEFVSQLMAELPEGEFDQQDHSRAIIAYWENNFLTEWHESRINLYVDGISELLNYPEGFRQGYYHEGLRQRPPIIQKDWRELRFTHAYRSHRAQKAPGQKDIWNVVGALDYHHEDIVHVMNTYFDNNELYRWSPSHAEPLIELLADAPPRDDEDDDDDEVSAMSDASVQFDTSSHLRGFSTPDEIDEAESPEQRPPRTQKDWQELRYSPIDSQHRAQKAIGTRELWDIFNRLCFEYEDIVHVMNTYFDNNELIFWDRWHIDPLTELLADAPPRYEDEEASKRSDASVKFDTSSHLRQFIIPDEIDDDDPMFKDWKMSKNHAPPDPEDHLSDETAFLTRWITEDVEDADDL